MLLKKALLISGTMIIPLGVTSVGLGQARALSPESIVKKMSVQYATAMSYQDTGTVETFNERLSSRRTDISFKSYFGRPNLFRFEWTIYSLNLLSQDSIIWCDGQHTYGSYGWKDAKIELKEDLSLGIAGATGVSRGSSHTIPHLLMPSISGFSLTELSNLTTIQESQFEGDDCYLIRGQHPSGESWELWIGKTDYLLRKLRTRDIDDTFKEEIHREIKLSNPVSLDVFRPKQVNGRIDTGPNKSKDAVIRQLLALIVSSESFNQLISDTLERLKRLIPQVPDLVWNEVTKDSSFNADMIVQIYLPLYDKHYDEAEINELVKFYRTPLGKKVARVNQLIEFEAAKEGEQRATEFIRRIHEKLRDKGYKVAAL